MIPFFTRKSKPAVPAASPADVDIEVDVDLADLEQEELELTDDDFVLLEASPPPPPISKSILRAALAAVPPPPPVAAPPPISKARLDTLRTKTLRAGLHAPPQPSLPAAPAEPVREPRRSFPRLSSNDDAEASVADECLASIAAAASHARASDPFVAVAPPASSSLVVRPHDEVDALLADVSAFGKLPPPSVPPARPAATAAVTIPPPSSSSSIALSPRLPPVSPPPFVRASVPPARISVPGVAEEISDANDAAETLPVPMKTPFARTSTDDERASRPSVVPSLPPSARSVVPVTASRREPTVVVVRDRPRAGWVVAAAAIGALAAITIMRIAAPQAPSGAPAAALPPPQAEPVTPAAVVRFGEEEGVSIKVPAPAAAPHSAVAVPAHVARPAPTTRAVSNVQPARAPVARPSRPLQPKVSPPTPLPDGSLGLANTGKATPSTVAPAPTPLPLPPSGGRKRPLTPEQELAEAQLRAAAMR